MARTQEERKAERAQRIADRRAARAEKRDTRQSERTINTKADRQARRQETKPLANQQVSQASDYKFDQYRKNSVNSAELRNLRSQGHSREDIRAAAESSGLRMGKAAERRLDRWDAKAKARADAKERAQSQIEDPLPAQPAPAAVAAPPSQVTKPPATTQPSRPEVLTPPQPPADVYEPPNVSVPTIPGTPGTNVNPVQDNDMTQQVQQDNDITNTIDGDGNYVVNNQDNSIRQYGGDNRQFTYVGGNNPALDTPASAATLAGYWDVNDSPAKQAAFVDLHSTINADNQKKYANVGHITQGAIHRANMNSTINTNALDKRIYEREQYSRAKADMMGMNLFGDMYNMQAPTWQSPERQTEVKQPDFEEMYDTMTDF